MTLKGGTGQACARCKYQRRRCTTDCPLAPYFPADQPKMFLNAHRLFGVSNMLKILKDLDPQQQKMAMKSIIYEANARSDHPVYGCVGEIERLVYEIQRHEEELHAVQLQLALLRQQSQQQQQQQQEISISSIPNDSPSQFPLGTGMMAINGALLTLFHQDGAQQNWQNIGSHVASCSNSGNNGAYSNSYLDSKENVVNSLWIQQPYGDGNQNTDQSSLALQSQLIASQEPPLVIQQETSQEYDEIHPFFDTIDDRQSYIESKDPYESSQESSLRESTHSLGHITENELKSAAACFTLTSVN